MLDFLMVSTRNTKKDVLEIYPKFKVMKSKDLMIRGSDFYAVFDYQTGYWSMDEDTVTKLVDLELQKKAEETRKIVSENTQIKVAWMWDSDSGSIAKWHRYCQSHMRDNWHEIDASILFGGDKVTRESYASRALSYSLSDATCTNWNELIGTLYSPTERKKIEWAIGAIFTGDSKTLQKFLVLYGEGGTGKSTIINVIEQLFDGYWAAFDAKALGSNNAAFALEPFKNNPLVAIQHDGDLSRIEDNTRLNSIVSHETMTVNEKHKTQYSAKFHSFLIMGTNRPVKITDAKSGIIRRLIDVTPTGNKIPRRRYNDLVRNISFELGSIAKHCISVYQADPGMYDDYIPSHMLNYSNDFYNFVIDNYDELKKGEGISLDVAYTLYNEYCEGSKISYPFSKRVFKQELANYFREFYDRISLDGKLVKGYFKGFLTNKFAYQKTEEEPKETSWLEFTKQTSLFDTEFAEYKAQYANEKEKPFRSWDLVKTHLKDINTSKLHYVLLPIHHIIIDFDLKDENGEKSLEKNLQAASKWVPTYAELSKSGKGIHLHYFYSGDPEKLERLYAKDIEIKVFTGKSSLRRMLTKCNNLPIASISSNLPLREEKKVINTNSVKDEMHLRSIIGKALRKEVHPGTKPNIDFINKVLTDAYESGMKYDITDMRPFILSFAMASTHQAKYCVDLVATMPFKSEESIDNPGEHSGDIIIFDVEVLPNLFVIVCKPLDKDPEIYINPGRDTVALIIKSGKLVGFNNKKYDNHILYAASMGYSTFELFALSKKIIVDKSKNAFFGNAYNISYTDIYDFSSKKQSLKKWEIELGIHHQELGIPWDEPVDESKWDTVAQYCVNDVIATEALFKHLSSDFQARLILADVAGMSPNTSTNSLTAKIIFGEDRTPQEEFNYRDLSKPVVWSEELRRTYGEEYEFHIFDALGQPTYEIYHPGDPLPKGYSILPFFPGYTYEAGVSTYLGDVVGEGGRVYAEVGAYGDVGLLDVASMHPHSVIAEALFGPRYTKRFADIVNMRIAIKHKDFDTAKLLLNGAFARHLDDGVNPKDLAYALKIAINSVYGMTSAKFDNKFRDIRNVDNIVAKRGALFMSNLKVEVQKRGYTVAHIKTDSIKIPDATPEIIDFVHKYGREFGYTFEHEATYEKMCLVNDAVYIAKYKKKEDCERMYGYIPGDNAEKSGKWTATGTQFAVPYVFKTLFSHEGIEFKDLCVTNAVTTYLYLDRNEDMYTELLLEHGYFDTDTILDDDFVKTALKTVGIKKKDVEELLADPNLHDYRFVGKVGNFCPIKPGSGGGLLLRQNNSGGYGAATGSKGYRWLESEEVQKRGLTDQIDMRYFEGFVEDAKKSIEQYCDFNWFASDDIYIPDMIPYIVK